MEHLPEQRARALAKAIARTFTAEMEHLEECAACRARVFHLVVRAKGLEYQHAFDHSAEQAFQLLPQVAEEKAAAPALLSELMALPVAEREAAVEAGRRFQTYALATLTLNRSERAVHQDPAVARELAHLGYVVASRLDPRHCGGTAAQVDLEAYALAAEGNALRVAGDLRAALRTFTSARRRQEKGGADPDLAARIDLAEASLCRDLRHFKEALALLDRAEETFRALKDSDQLARTVTNRANVFSVQGEFVKAAATLKGALNVARDPSLTLGIRHNLIDILVKSGRAEEAAALFEQTKDLYLQQPDALAANRRQWVEGMIARELGEYEKASRLLSAVVSGLAEHGYSFDAALAGLDLVAVFAKQGKATEVLRVASELVQLFEVRSVHPEALAALNMVHQAAEREAVNLALLGRAAETVRRVGRVRSN
jgi:tetratricopeptide (TPR) repeat protein